MSYQDMTAVDHYACIASLITRKDVDDLTAREIKAAEYAVEEAAKDAKPGYQVDPNQIRRLFSKWLYS